MCQGLNINKCIKLYKNSLQLSPLFDCCLFEFWRAPLKTLSSFSSVAQNLTTLPSHSATVRWELGKYWNSSQEGSATKGTGEEKDSPLEKCNKSTLTKLRPQPQKLNLDLGNRKVAERKLSLSVSGFGFEFSVVLGTWKVFQVAT